MKKFISFAAAAAVAITSFSTFAAPYYSDYAKADRKIINVPDEDTVETKLDIKSGSSSSYSDHSTQASAMSTTSTSMNVNAQAELDMTNVAKEWEAYLDAAENSGVQRATAVSAANLEGVYTIKIIGDEAINNAKLEATDPTGWTLDSMTTELFKQTDVNYDAASHTFTLELSLKSKADDPDINTKLDAYFTSLNAGTAASKVLTLTVEDTTVTAQNTLTTAGEYHKVDGQFSGYVNIGVTIAGISKTYKVNFGGTDTEYYKLYKRSGGGGGGGSTIPTQKPVETQPPTETEAPTATPIPEGEINVPVIPGSNAALNYEDHYAYIIGYPSESGNEDELSEVRPQNNITRAEVATIFFRLLTNESRDKFWTQDNDFSDVLVDSWYNNAVSTAANAGIVNGYDDGTFRPDAPITRAEFAAIASRFSSVVYDGEDKFSDISSHWAREAINKAAATGWVNGYEDGTFGPDKYITRAEAVTLINRVLYRIVENSSLRDDMVKWSDNLDTSAWYYAAIQEATNSHDYDRDAIGHVEKWSSFIAPPDWEALEKESSKSDAVRVDESVYSTSGLEELDDSQEVQGTEETEATEDAEVTEDAGTTEDTETTEITE